MAGAFWGTRVMEIVKKHDFGDLVWKRIKLTSTRKANAKKHLHRIWDNESKQKNSHKEGNSTEHSHDLSLNLDGPESLANNDGPSPSSTPRQEELVSRVAISDCISFYVVQHQYQCPSS